MLLLTPEIIIFITALGVLIYDLVAASKSALFRISIFGLLISQGLLLYHFLLNSFLTRAFFFGLYVADPLALIFKIIFVFIGLIVLLINREYFAQRVKNNEGEFYFLFLISIVGLMMAVSSPNLLFIYLCIELVGLTSYVLTGFLKKNLKSQEAALKYFLFGAVSSAIFLYGISLFYGISGTFSLLNVVGLNPADPVVYIASLFIILGLAFKIALAPMQFWCPDVYEGAPTPITAYLSVGPKAAGFAVLIRFITMIGVDLSFMFAIIAVLTMTWGNLVALRQTNIKRLLAYSSIAQAGYILIGLSSFQFGYPSMIYYLLAYVCANLGAFTVAIGFSNALNSEEIESYSGMGVRSPMMAAAFALFFLSLIGIPPLGGFVGKFLVFGTAVGANYIWLVVVGIINSVISVYYYLNVVRVMYFERGESGPLMIPSSIYIAVSFCLGATLLLGIFPNLLLR